MRLRKELHVRIAILVTGSVTFSVIDSPQYSDATAAAAKLGIPFELQIVTASRREWAVVDELDVAGILLGQNE
jgi:hypothetical protein